jgi:hypothetical protein
MCILGFGLLRICCLLGEVRFAHILLQKYMVVLICQTAHIPGSLATMLK